MGRCEPPGDLVPFLESLLTHAVTQGTHSRAVFHAGSLIWRGRTILLPGERGAGKSTATLGLALRGGIYLGDDLCFIDYDSLRVSGLTKAATLKQGSFPLFSESATYTDLLRGPVRYVLPAAHGAADDPPRAPAAFIFPRFQREAPDPPSRLDPPVLALALLQQSYGGTDRGEQQLRLVARLAESVPGWLIPYRHLDELQDRLDGILA